MEATHAHPEKNSFIAIDTVEFIETTACQLLPEEARPEQGMTTPVPTEPPDGKTLW